MPIHHSGGIQRFRIFHQQRLLHGIVIRINKFGFPINVLQIHNAVHVITVTLMLDHVPAYRRSLIQRDIHQVGNLRGAGRLDNVFPNIVIDIIRTGYSSPRPIESTDIDSTCTDRIILIRSAISGGVRLANEELRTRLCIRQTGIFHGRGGYIPRIYPLV